MVTAAARERARAQRRVAVAPLQAALQRHSQAATTTVIITIAELPLRKLPPPAAKCKPLPVKSCREPNSEDNTSVIVDNEFLNGVAVEDGCV